MAAHQVLRIGARVRGIPTRIDPRLTQDRIGVKGAADTEFSTMRGLPTALLAHGLHRDLVAGAAARLRLTETTAKTTTKTV